MTKFLEKLDYKMVSLLILSTTALMGIVGMFHGGFTMWQGVMFGAIGTITFLLIIVVTEILRIYIAIPLKSYSKGLVDKWLNKN